MSLPASFSNNTSPTGVQLDNNFAAVANMGLWNTSATGTNVIALTTTSNQPAVSAYADRQRFQFIGPNNSSGSVTVAVNSLSALPLYLIGGAQAGSGDITSGTPYQIIYLAALNSAAGGFQIVSSVPSSSAVAQANGLVHGLVIVNNTSTPSTKIDITAGYSVLTTTGGTPKFLSSVSVTIDLTTTGANGMDTGSRPTSGWVYNYVINNGSVTAGLATATAPTAGLPTLPGGYTNFAYAGAMYCDGSQNLLRSKQIGRVGEYQPTASTNTAVLPVLDNGAKGTYSSTSPTLGAVTVTAFVPATASRITVAANNSYKNGTISALIVAPLLAYGGSNNGPKGSAGQSYPIYLDTGAAGGATASMDVVSGTIYWASSQAGASIACLGWTDYYSAG